MLFDRVSSKYLAPTHEKLDKQGKTRGDSEYGAGKHYRIRWYME